MFFFLAQSSQPQFIVSFFLSLNYLSLSSFGAIVGYSSINFPFLCYFLSIRVITFSVFLFISVLRFNYLWLVNFWSIVRQLSLFQTRLILSFSHWSLYFINIVLVALPFFVITINLSSEISVLPDQKILLRLQLVNVPSQVLNLIFWFHIGFLYFLHFLF